MDLRVDLRGETCLLMAALCLVLPLNWVFASILAAVVHEGFHLLAVVLQGGKIQNLTIGPGGAVMEASGLSPFRQLTAILAGPMGSLLLLVLRRMQPTVAICGLVQGLFNLLPVYPLDGGRALALLCGMLFPEPWARRVCAGVFYLVVAMVLAGGIWGTLLAGLGSAPLVFSLILLSAAVKSKISCKEGNQRVQ